MQETLLQSLGQENPVEKETATHSSILAWEIPWLEEPGGLQSMGSQRLRHDLATKHLTTTTPLFMTALFTIARTWKQSRCPSTDEWIKKLCHIYTMEYYSAIEKNKFESALVRWMNLRPGKQSELRSWHLVPSLHGK